jgi:hypothetical protein
MRQWICSVAVVRCGTAARNNELRGVKSGVPMRLLHRHPRDLLTLHQSVPFIPVTLDSNIRKSLDVEKQYRGTFGEWHV